MFCSVCGRPLLRVPPTKCLSCGARHWNDAKPCASALVVRGSQLLMVRRAQEPWRDTWDVPGGFCEPGEHPARTAQREVLEETGLQIRVVGFLGIWLDEYPEAGGALKRTINIYYHAVPAGLATALLDGVEVVEARFFSASQLPEPLAFPGHVPAALEAWKQAASSGELVTRM